ncbi:hypothetical protein SAMN05216483_6249 [Streptomyces sp. 2131.1]|uniref:hypothetical protein n=1 Tax=Streptomyces sp. 2131.1 TaxID=1855346 RepID=UPI00089AA245|nr:hypothetical protein [Streptomyces sp. 2131.1]SEE44829.1 hypothetical protein SAMN05216483_6249 [Streptomyces sp. 2131.1]
MARHCFQPSGSTQFEAGPALVAGDAGPQVVNEVTLGVSGLLVCWGFAAFRPLLALILHLCPGQPPDP